MTRNEEIRKEALNWKTDDNEFIAQTAFEAGALWADEHQKSPWISVKDRLPQYEHSVMLALSDGTYSTGYLTHDIIDGEKYWDVDCFESFAEVNDNDYWMPIPKLPKGGEK